MLDITNLHASVEGHPILRGLDLSVKAGEVHAIMGPNGSGKSTLSAVIAGHEAYEITQGDIRLDGKSLLELEPNERATAGLFLAFQYPVEIPGVNNVQFLRAALNAHRKSRGEGEIEPAAFLKLLREKIALLALDEKLVRETSGNEGFSGGEKKRFEILQMALLEPRCCILDETDSGLDIDALKIVAKAVNSLRAAGRAIVLITHYQRLLDHITPDVVHVLVAGRIAKTGGAELPHELEAKGYDWLTGAPAATAGAAR